MLSSPLFIIFIRLMLARLARAHHARQQQKQHSLALPSPIDLVT
jgi:hypothetical protein